jgi:hypothetical protein
MSIATNRKERLSEAARMANVPSISVSRGEQGGVMYTQVLNAFEYNVGATRQEVLIFKIPF